MSKKDCSDPSLHCDVKGKLEPDHSSGIIKLLRGCPFGIHQGKLLTHRSTTEADIVAWVAEVYALLESDGPIPGPNSMLSFGSAAFSADGKILDTFSANLETLPGAYGNPDTMAWWQDPKQQAAWEACRKDLQPPEAAMKRFVEWVNKLSDQHKAQPVFVAYPAGFDGMFMYWYAVRFVGRSPFSFSALDMKTLAMSLLGCPYREATKKRFPKRWFPENAPHTHVALDDAIEQGHIFCNMLKEIRRQEP